MLMRLCNHELSIMYCGHLVLSLSLVLLATGLVTETLIYCTEIPIFLPVHEAIDNIMFMYVHVCMLALLCDSLEVFHNSVRQAVSLPGCQMSSVGFRYQ